MQGMHKHIHVHFTSIFTSVSPYIENHEIIPISIIQFLYHRVLVFSLVLYVYFSSPIMRSLTPIVLNIFLIELSPLHITNFLSPPLSPSLADIFSHSISLQHSTPALPESPPSVMEQPPPRTQAPTPHASRVHREPLSLSRSPYST